MDVEDRIRANRHYRRTVFEDHCWKAAFSDNLKEVADSYNEIFGTFRFYFHNNPFLVGVSGLGPMVKRIFANVKVFDNSDMWYTFFTKFIATVNYMNMEVSRRKQSNLTLSNLLHNYLFRSGYSILEGVESKDRSIELIGIALKLKVTFI